MQTYRKAGLVGCVLLALSLWTQYGLAAQNDGLVSVAPPSYTHGMSAPFSLTTSGEVRIAGGVATATPPSLVEGAPASFSFDLAGNARFTLGTCLSGESACVGTSPSSYVMTVPGVTRTVNIMTDVITNTSSATTAIPGGSKTIFATITGTGAQSVTVEIFGDTTTTANEEFLICTLSPSGTTTDEKKCTQFSDDFPFYHAKTTSISGTDATVDVFAQVGSTAGGATSVNAVVTNAGTFATQVDGAALTALQLIDNLVADPCAGNAKTHIPINIVTATTTELTGALSGASTFYYVCSIDLITAAANNVALVDDNTDGCGSPTAGLAGGVTAATGWNFAANGGIVKGNGTGTVFKAVTSNAVLCLMTSAATQLSGSIQVVAAP